MGFISARMSKIPWEGGGEEDRKKEGRLKKRERKSGERSERMKLSTTSNLYITLWPSLGLTYTTCTLHTYTTPPSHMSHPLHTCHTHFT